MSRRKQARPKSCKLEGLSGQEDEETRRSVEYDQHCAALGTVKDVTDMSYEGTSQAEAQTAEMASKTAHDLQAAPIAGAMAADTYRCEACCAIFTSLSQFMDHCNFVCPSDTRVTAWSAGDKEEWGETPDTGSLASSVDVSVLSPVPDHLSEDQLPFTIGINETNSYGCQYCEKAFSRHSHLHLHEKVHADQPDRKCLHCERQLRHKRTRDRHMKLHSADRKFTCHVCDVTFSRHEQLKSHLQTHDASVLYQCPVCQIGYSSTTALTLHLSSHQDQESGDITQASELCCLLCGQGCVSLQELQQHMSAVHTTIKLEKISCDMCSEEFSSQEALDTHIESSHYGTQPMDIDNVDTTLMFKCPICIQQFSDTLVLCHHLMTHASPGTASDINLQSLTRNVSKQVPDLSLPLKDVSRTCTPKQSPSAIEISSPSTPGMSKAQVLVCPYCLSDSFETLESLELHMQSIHSVKSNEIYTCNYCNAPYPNLYSLHDHMNVVHRNHPGMGIKYPCSLCNNQFPSIEALAKHKSLSHSFQDNSEGSGRAGRIDSAFCGVCSLTLPTARQLEEHMISVHGASLDKKSVKSKGKRSAGKGNKENKHIPSSKVKTPRTLSMSSGTTDSASSVSPVQAYPASTVSESITCDQCNATFYELVNFQAHMKLHLESVLAKFTCKKCGQQLGSQEQLEAHMSLHYLCLATEYGCTSCTKLFSKPDELQKHLMDIHAHHLYRCALCKEIFDSKVNIQVHFAIKHSNECKLFKCTQCSNIFRSEMEWQVHVRVNHLHVAKPYRCLFCSESFTSEMELQCHLTTHSKPFRCPMCEQAFHIEYLLDQHLQTDHGDSDCKGTALLHNRASSLALIPIKEETESLPLAQLLASRSPRPPSCDTQKSISPAVQQTSSSPVGTSAVWKNSEAVHVCNICDSRFTQQLLLTIHKAQEHGLKSMVTSTTNQIVSPVGKGSQSSPVLSIPMTHSQSPRDKLLLSNQTLVSVLTGENPATISSLSCTFCSQTFKNQLECEKHMKIHANSSSLKCNICDETFPSPATLAEHKLQHCKVQQGNACCMCKLSLKTEEQFYAHAQEHGYKGTMLQCIVCRQTLASVVELQMHGKHHFQVRPSFYTCCVCLKTFDSKENLVSKLNSSGRTYYVCKPCYHGESPLFTCPQCSDKFASRAQLEAHMVTHVAACMTTMTAGTALVTAVPTPTTQTFQCIKCQESFTTEYEIQLHVANHMLQEGIHHECKLCTLVLDSPAKLQCHLIEHTFKNSADFQCGVCSRSFNSALEIQAHALEHGAQGKKHACGQCSQHFFFLAELENHALIYNHSTTSGIQDLQSSKIHECQECKKTFASATALANHRKTHERRETNIKCSLCTQTFTTVVRMQQHFLVTHATANGDDTLQNETKRIYSCLHCKQPFSTPQSLQAHVKTHKTGSTKYSCPVCSKTFSHTRNLTSHLRSHTTDKPFQCQACQKRFSREENLKAHMSFHTGLTQSLMCPLCNKSFTCKADITDHLKTHFSNTQDVGQDQNDVVPKQPSPDFGISSGTEHLPTPVTQLIFPIASSNGVHKENSIPSIFNGFHQSDNSSEVKDMECHLATDRLSPVQTKTD